MDGIKTPSFLCLSGSKGNSYSHHFPLETDSEMCEDKMGTPSKIKATKEKKVGRKSN